MRKARRLCSNKSMRPEYNNIRDMINLDKTMIKQTYVCPDTTVVAMMAGDLAQFEPSIPKHPDSSVDTGGSDAESKAATFDEEWIEVGKTNLWE